MDTYSARQHSRRVGGGRKAVSLGCRGEGEMELLVAALLLIFLLASTLGWAVVYSRQSLGGSAVDDDLARTRLWASAVPLGVILVLIAASLMALFRSHPIGGIESLRFALGMRPTVVGLVVCGAAALVPSVKCVRAWRSSNWATSVRLHMSGFLLALVVAIALLLRAGQ
jgi:hypothetical protein